MALSLSLARTAPLAAVSAGSGARRLPATSLAFPPKSLFGAPLAAAAASVASPLPRKPATTSLAVVAAGKKGYKMKTHKASAKRFRVTGRGKIVRRCAGKQHLLTKKNTKSKKRLSKMQKADGRGNSSSFSLDAEYSGLFFVLNLDEYTWLRNLDNGSDFFISLTRVEQRGSTQDLDKVVPQKVDKPSQTDGIISDIRHLVVGLSSRRGQRAKNKVLQEDILQEIERLAAEAYSIFRSPTIDSAEASVDLDDPSIAKPACSGTGSGFEILCQ